MNNLSGNLLLSSVALLFSGAPSSAQAHRKVEVPTEIVQQLMNDYEGLSAGDLRAEMIDLNDDERQELIVQGDCAAVGNCSTWIYRKTRKGYQQLLNDEAQVVKSRRTITHDYHDVVFEVHGSAYESEIRLYKFDGKQYQLKECFFRDYSFLDKRGRFHTRRRPQITRMKCESE
ncbi:MAG TPA: hypothetical protein VLJ61_06960 [Pyrinomonadaceae bacterium]|nr:hypothetical protein [Pyrinomonadaceae bacterium]